MKPEAPRVLQGIMLTLFTQVLPEVDSPHGQQTVQLAGGLLNIVGQEFDRAADRLVFERSALKSLFERALPVVRQAELRAKLEAAIAAVPEPSLRIQALQKQNDGLRGLLIELHAAMEEDERPDARAVEAAIWDELRESTRRRHVESGLA
ncbi:MAG: hypothetical protein WEC33_00100 [Dehalococcoidia bacterium]